MRPLKYGPITLSPVTGFIGAEVVAGAHIGKLDDKTFSHLRQAWIDWKVLFFRDQHDVTTSAHIEFGCHLGDIRRRMERVTLLGSKPYGPTDERAKALTKA